MKKLIFFIMFLTLFLCLIGSSGNGTIFTRVSSQSLYTPRPGVDENFPLVYIDQEDEIRTFAESQETYEDFVSYDDISFLGEFVDFRVLALNQAEGGYGSYIYRLKDPCGFPFKLIINLDGPPNANKLELPIPRKGMVLLGTPESGFLERCGVKYVYSQGLLRGFIWKTDGIEFEIAYDPSQPIHEYSQSWWQNTFLESMLYGTDRQIERALEDFSKQLHSSGNEADTLMTILWSVIALAVAGLAVFLILRARRKNRNAAPACAAPDAPEAPAAPNFPDAPDTP